MPPCRRRLLQGSLFQLQSSTGPQCAGMDKGSQARGNPSAAWPSSPPYGHQEDLPAKGCDSWQGSPLRGQTGSTMWPWVIEGGETLQQQHGGLFALGTDNPCYTTAWQQMLLFWHDPVQCHRELEYPHSAFSLAIKYPTSRDYFLKDTGHKKVCMFIFPNIHICLGKLNKHNAFLYVIFAKVCIFVCT